MGSGTPLDRLTEKIRDLAPEGSFPYVEIQTNKYGWTVVAWDTQPVEGLTDHGQEIRGNLGSMVTAGSGDTFNAAVDAALRAIEPVEPTTPVEPWHGQAAKGPW